MRKLLTICLAALLSALNSNAQELPSFEKHELIRGSDTLRYRIQYPVKYDAKKKYPVVLVLHGSGERGDDNQAQLKWGGTLFADPATRETYPAIVIFPQCPSNDAWGRIGRDTTDPLRFQFLSDQPIGKSLNLVSVLLDSVAATPTVNTKKIYVGGLSMGGMGTFEILWRKAGFFAAAFPICGGGDPAKVKLYANKFPIWVFHGDADPVVPVENSRRLVTALTSAGAKVTYNEYPGVGHDSWNNAFAEPELLSWLFAQTNRNK